MLTNHRREFLRQTGVGISAAAIAAAPRLGKAENANDTIVVGLIGCGGRGTYLSGLLLNDKKVELAYVCDVDADRLAKAVKFGKSPQAVGDMRKIFDDKNVDAVVIATPDHWHSPAAILACDAGKHVYCEKPCSHNIREGRLLVDAARRNKRIVQHGTQVRSTPMMIEAVQKLREGVIGDVLVAKVWNIQRRGSIGRGAPSEPPAGLDYDSWVGPAPMIPFQANRVQHGWQWCYHFGTGDMGNDGVHDIDYGRWGLGVETHPSLVSAVGGKYFFDDDQQFPDTQQVAFEYPGDGTPGKKRMLIYEQRLWSTNYPHNTDSGVEFYGTKGQLFLSRRGKAQFLAERNQKLDITIPLGEQDAPSHMANFLDCVRSGNKPNGEIELGHLTASLSHLGNISTRLGRSLKFDPATEQILGDEEANKLVTREYRDHWGRPQVL